VKSVLTDFFPKLSPNVDAQEPLGFISPDGQCWPVCPKRSVGRPKKAQCWTWLANLQALPWPWD